MESSSSDWFVDRTKTKKRTIPHPADTAKPDDEKRKLEIYLRPLDAGDMAAIDEEVGLAIGESGARFSLFTHKVGMVTRALVSWSLPDAVIPERISQLPPPVIDAIFAHVELFEGGADVDADHPTIAASSASSSADSQVDELAVANG